MPFVFLSSSLIFSAQVAQSAPWMENTCTRSAQDGAAASKTERDREGTRRFIDLIATSV
jgi:hypothetical protein